jgi:hypothetical protein
MRTSKKDGVKESEEIQRWRESRRGGINTPVCLPRSGVRVSVCVCVSSLAGEQKVVTHIDTHIYVTSALTDD